jgi:hypothetical protein
MIDTLSLLRKEAINNPKLVEPLGIKYEAETVTEKSAA